MADVFLFSNENTSDWSVKAKHNYGSVYTTDLLCVDRTRSKWKSESNIASHRTCDRDVDVLCITFGVRCICATAYSVLYTSFAAVCVRCSMQMCVCTMKSVRIYADCNSDASKCALLMTVTPSVDRRANFLQFSNPNRSTACWIGHIYLFNSQIKVRLDSNSTRIIAHNKQYSLHFSLSSHVQSQRQCHSPVTSEMRAITRSQYMRTMEKPKIRWVKIDLIAVALR